MRIPVILAVFSALLLGASFAPIGLSPLSWVSMVPLFCALGAIARRERSFDLKGGKCAWIKRPFLVGFFFGLLFFLVTVYWVAYSMYVYGGGALLFYLFLLCFSWSLFLLVYPAIFAVLWVLVSRRKRLLVRLFLVPAAWVGLEYLRGPSYLPVFRGHLAGYTQARVLRHCHTDRRYIRRLRR